MILSNRRVTIDEVASHNNSSLSLIIIICLSCDKQAKKALDTKTCFILTALEILLIDGTGVLKIVILKLSIVAVKNIECIEFFTLTLL